MSEKTKKSLKESATNIAIDALNTVPLLGTVTKSVADLVRSRIEDSLDTYVRGALQGDDVPKPNRPDAECFIRLAELVARDVYAGKACYYSNAFRFIKSLEGDSRPIADFLLEAIPEMTLKDFTFIQELSEILKTHKKSKEKDLGLALGRFYKQSSDGQNISRLWYQRRSLLKLEFHGILIDHPTFNIPWPAEHFDVIACVANGTTLDGASLTKPSAEQGGADQPATAPESKPEGNQEPKPES